MSFHFTVPIPLSLYVHLPWCVKKCPYCDFNSYAVREEIPEKAYVDALLKDLEGHLPNVWGRRIQSVFLGGGTPSLFSPQAIYELLSGIRRLLPLRPDCEITLEANPGTVEQDRFTGFHEAGINRLSLGIQSFNSAQLKSLGRIHGAEEAHRAIEIATSSGFQSINLDLMFGLPNQDVGSCLKDLESAISYRPEHISFYQLTLEPNTEFHVHPPKLPDEDRLWEMQQEGQNRLKNAGYHQYEVSAYAMPGQECAHNRNYWEFGDYLAIGAGAHGKLTLPDEQLIQRYWNYRQPGQYLEKVAQQAAQNTRQLAPEEAIFEFMLNALRLTHGFALELFSERTGLNPSAISEALKAGLDENLLHIDDGYVRPAALGQRFLDDLVARFLPTT